MQMGYIKQMQKAIRCVQSGFLISVHAQDALGNGREQKRVQRFDAAAGTAAAAMSQRRGDNGDD